MQRRFSHIWRVTSTSHDVYDFDRIGKLVKRLDAIESSGPETLSNFYDPRLKSFSIKPGRHEEDARMCITSTCYALLTMCLSSDAYKSMISVSSKGIDMEEDNDSEDEEDEESDAESMILNDPTNKEIPIQQVLIALLAATPRQDDLFQIPLLLYTLLRVDSNRSILRSAVKNEYTAAKIKRLIGTVIAARPHRSSGAAQIHSDYIIYQVCKVLACLQEYKSVQRDDTAIAQKEQFGGLPLSALPENVASDAFWALLRCNEVGFNELCRQLAYRAAGDFNLFDAIRLAYSLLTYVRSTQSLSDVAGKETDKGKGPAADTRVNPLNKRLVKTALATFFQEQGSDGLWDKGQPIYKSLSEGKGRSMGNAFVFSVNTVGSLLCLLPAEYFRPHLDGLERTLKWIEDHDTVEIFTTHCDEDGNCYGRPLRGWTSPHLGPGTGPQAWPTAQVLKCVSWMKRTIQQLQHNDVLEEFHGIAYSEKGVQEDSWERLLDTDIGDRSLKSVLEERIIHPFAKSIQDPSYGACYSAILFGPPGTAKTTVCEALAQKLGYDFVCIDTAAFLADGLSNVASRIRYVFSRLMALEKTIILFDEIEEFALSRENKDLSMESRMLTTSMLTAINDLRRNKKSIFFIATNRLRAFDSAVIRPGRFDLQLFVGTPNLDSRVIQLQQKLNALPVQFSDKVKARAIDNYRTFLESVWREDALFMNFLEGLQFATSCAAVLAANGKLTKDDMGPIFKKQAAVMTVRGTAREEYLASMKLSRL